MGAFGDLIAWLVVFLLFCLWLDSAHKAIR